jgi:DNA-binding response OmpR family regulator
MLNRTRVLIVGPHQDMLESLPALLESHGYKAKRIYGACTIVADVRDFDPDVVIMDIAMRDRNGWDAARELRQCRRRGKRPVLIGVSGQYTKRGDKTLAEMSAYDYYVLKPCDPKALLQLVASYSPK